MSDGDVVALGETLAVAPCDSDWETETVGTCVPVADGTWLADCVCVNVCDSVLSALGVADAVAVVVPVPDCVAVSERVADMDGVCVDVPVREGVCVSDALCDAVATWVRVADGLHAVLAPRTRMAE